MKLESLRESLRMNEYTTNIGQHESNFGIGKNEGRKTNHGNSFLKTFNSVRTSMLDIGN